MARFILVLSQKLRRHGKSFLTTALQTAPGYPEAQALASVRMS